MTQSEKEALQEELAQEQAYEYRMQQEACSDFINQQEVDALHNEYAPSDYDDLPW